jgi:hypothetical protein
MFFRKIVALTCGLVIHLFCLNALFGQCSDRNGKLASLATKVDKNIRELIGDANPSSTLILVSIGSTILNAYSYKNDKRHSDTIEQAIDELEVLAAELRKLKEKYTVIGVTSYNQTIGNASLVNGRLIALNIKMSFLDRDFHVQCKENNNTLSTPYFSFGVLHCIDSYKGQALVALMQQLKINPQKIVFICDTVDDYKSIGSVIVEKLKVQYSGSLWSSVLTI